MKIINKVSVSFPWALILFVVFMVLKLTDVIDWSWWWVTAPLWIGLVIGLGIAVIAFLFMAIYAIITAARS